MESKPGALTGLKKPPPPSLTGQRGFVLLLVAALVALFPAVLLCTETFYYRDYSLFGYPLAVHFQQSLFQGELPLWNPLNNCGVPFLAQWNTMTLYPPMWVCALLPAPWALGFFCLAHLVLGGVGMFRLTRGWTGDELAAGVAGMAFALSGLLLHALMWPNNIAALGLMPWVVSWFEQAARLGGRKIIWAAGGAAFQILAGAPEIIAFTWLTGLVLGWLAGRAETAARFPLRPGFRLAMVGALALALTAVQLLPFLQLVACSQRDVQYDTNAWAMPAWGWANLVVPLFRATPSMTGVYTQLEQEWTSSYYVGLAVLALALLGLGRSRPARVWALAGLSLLGLWMALGAQGGLYALAKAIFPPLGMLRFPVKFVVLAVFALPALAAYGLAEWNQGRVSVRRLLISLAALLGVMVALLAATWISPAKDEDWVITWINGLSRAAILVAFGAGLWWQRKLAGTPAVTGPAPWYTGWLRVGLVALVAVDGITHVPRQNPTVAEVAYAPITKMKEGRPQPGRDRFCLGNYPQKFLSSAKHPDPLIYCLTLRQMTFCNWNLVDGVAKINGFYSLYPRAHADVLDLIYLGTNAPPGPLLDFMGVTQMTSDEEMLTVIQRPQAMPLVTIGQQPVAAGRAQALRRLASAEFDPRREVLLPAGEVPPEIAGDPQARVRETRFATHQLWLEVEATRPALVVIAQTWYPCWRATLDRQAVPILRANHAFQAVAVPPGRHEIQLVYRDQPLFLGLAMSVLALLATAAAWRFLPHPAA